MNVIIRHDLFCFLEGIEGRLYDLDDPQNGEAGFDSRRKRKAAPEVLTGHAG